MGGDSRSKVHAISYPDTFTRPHRFIDYQNEKCASNTCSNNRCTIDNSRNEKYEKKRASLFNVSERTGPRSTVSRDNVKWFGMKLIKTTDWKKGDAQGDEYKFSWEHNPSKESCFRRGMEQYQSDNTSGAVTYDTQTKECYLEKNIPTTNWYKPKPNENYITARLDCDTNLCVTGIEQGGMVPYGYRFRLGHFDNDTSREQSCAGAIRESQTQFTRPNLRYDLLLPKHHKQPCIDKCRKYDETEKSERFNPYSINASVGMWENGEGTCTVLQDAQGNPLKRKFCDLNAVEGVKAFPYLRNSADFTVQPNGYPSIDTIPRLYFISKHISGSGLLKPEAQYILSQEPEEGCDPSFPVRIKLGNIDGCTTTYSKPYSAKLSKYIYHDAINRDDNFIMTYQSKVADAKTLSVFDSVEEIANTKEKFQQRGVCIDDSAQEDPEFKGVYYCRTSTDNDFMYLNWDGRTYLNGTPVISKPVQQGTDLDAFDISMILDEDAPLPCRGPCDTLNIWDATMSDEEDSLTATLDKVYEKFSYLVSLLPQREMRGFGLCPVALNDSNKVIRQKFCTPRKSYFETGDPTCLRSCAGKHGYAFSDSLQECRQRCAKPRCLQNCADTYNFFSEHTQYLECTERCEPDETSEVPSNMKDQDVEEETSEVPSSMKDQDVEEEISDDEIQISDQDVEEEISDDEIQISDQDVEEEISDDEIQISDQEEEISDDEIQISDQGEIEHLPTLTCPQDRYLCCDGDEDPEILTCDPCAECCKYQDAVTFDFENGIESADCPCRCDKA